MIGHNIDIVRERIQEAAERAGKYPDDIYLVAVTKNVAPEAIKESIELGIHTIGESKVQEALRKKDLIQHSVCWHLVGNLQTNKVKKAVQLFDMIQSLDSTVLAEAINKQAQNSGKIQECLIEIKISEEETKHGIQPQDIEKFIREAEHWPHIRIKGLMTIAPYCEDKEKTRPFFKRMKELFDNVCLLNLSWVDISVLSMGMSDDFDIAIQEGATMVRIGTAIYGERP